MWHYPLMAADTSDQWYFCCRMFILLLPSTCKCKCFFLIFFCLIKTAKHVFFWGSCCSCEQSFGLAVAVHYHWTQWVSLVENVLCIFAQEKLPPMKCVLSLVAVVLVKTFSFIQLALPLCWDWPGQEVNHLATPPINKKALYSFHWKSDILCLDEGYHDVHLHILHSQNTLQLVKRMQVFFNKMRSCRASDLLWYL